jgi:fatty acid desaturase
MRWYGYIHPLLAIVTLFYGVTIGQLALSRLDDWDFPLRRLRTRTLIYFILTVINIGLGLLFNFLLSQSGKPMKLLAHLPLAITVSVLALLATIITYSRSKKPGELAPSLRWHPLLITASLALIMTMGFTALLKVLKI